MLGRRFTFNFCNNLVLFVIHIFSKFNPKSLQVACVDYLSYLSIYFTCIAHTKQTFPFLIIKIVEKPISDYLSKSDLNSKFQNEQYFAKKEEIQANFCEIRFI